MAKKETLVKKEVAALTERFPELSWMKPTDWQSVASFADWRSWLDESALNEDNQTENWPDYEGILSRLLKHRSNRVEIRKDCRSYFGADNVPNINDPEDPTWA
jgi:hypothetical protein